MAVLGLKYLVLRITCDLTLALPALVADKPLLLPVDHGLDFDLVGSGLSSISMVIGFPLLLLLHDHDECPNGTNEQCTTNAQPQLHVVAHFHRTFEMREA